MSSKKKFSDGNPLDKIEKTKELIITPYFFGMVTILGSSPIWKL